MLPYKVHEYAHMPCPEHDPYLRATPTSPTCFATPRCDEERVSRRGKGEGTLNSAQDIWIDALGIRQIRQVCRDTCMGTHRFDYPLDIQ